MAVSGGRLESTLGTDNVHGIFTEGQHYGDDMWSGLRGLAWSDGGIGPDGRECSEMAAQEGQQDKAWAWG